MLRNRTAWRLVSLGYRSRYAPKEAVLCPDAPSLVETEISCWCLTAVIRLSKLRAFNIHGFPKFGKTNTTLRYLFIRKLHQASTVAALSLRVKGGAGFYRHCPKKREPPDCSGGCIGHLPVPSHLRYRVNSANPRACLEQRSANAQRDRIEQIRGAIARAVVTERIHTFVRRL